MTPVMRIFLWESYKSDQKFITDLVSMFKGAWRQNIVWFSTGYLQTNFCLKL